MRIERALLVLPSVRNFIDDICEATRTKSVVALIPDTISRVMVARRIANRLDVLRMSWKDVQYSGEQYPATAISDQLNIEWPTAIPAMSTRSLLQCEGLPDLIHIRDFSTTGTGNTPERQRWLGLIREWVEASKNAEYPGVRTASRLCLVAKLKDFDFEPPVSQAGLSIHWWWGLPIVVGGEAGV